jgi:hypothetical protein
MRIYKDKQFLIFDFEDGKTVKYDFATKTAIGKKGKPVKDLRGQLSGMTMKELIECCDDQKYAKFLKFVQNKSYYSVYNIGTILAKVPYYAKFDGNENLIFVSRAIANGEFRINGSSKSRNLLCVGKETSIDGVRAKFIFLDDITQAKDKASLLEHTKDINKYRNTWRKT